MTPQEKELIELGYEYCLKSIAEINDILAEEEVNSFISEDTDTTDNVVTILTMARERYNCLAKYYELKYENVS